MAFTQFLPLPHLSCHLHVALGRRQLVFSVRIHLCHAPSVSEICSRTFSCLRFPTADDNGKMRKYKGSLDKHNIPSHAVMKVQLNFNYRGLRAKISHRICSYVISLPLPQSQEKFLECFGFFSSLTEL